MTPRAAAAVILARDINDRLELLLVRRTPDARFMPGVWVFPGGALDPADGDGQSGLRRAAVRELGEEAGIALPESTELVPLTRWITPAHSPVRFDTWFYVVAAPPNPNPRVDGSEIVEFRWLAPADALVASASGDLPLAFPTGRQLQQLTELGSVAALLDHARRSRVEPIEPRMIGAGENQRIVLPGDADY